MGAFDEFNRRLGVVPEVIVVGNAPHETDSQRIALQSVTPRGASPNVAKAHAGGGTKVKIRLVDGSTRSFETARTTSRLRCIVSPGPRRRVTSDSTECASASRGSSVWWPPFDRKEGGGAAPGGADEDHRHARGPGGLPVHLSSFAQTQPRGLISVRTIGEIETL